MFIRSANIQQGTNSGTNIQEGLWILFKLKFDKMIALKYIKFILKDKLKIKTSIMLGTVESLAGYCTLLKSKAILTHSSILNPKKLSLCLIFWIILKDLISSFKAHQKLMLL